MVFNPDLPKAGDANYWYWSKPNQKENFAGPTGQTIAQTYYNKEGNQALGIALKGAGDLIESSAKAADAVVTSSAKFESEQMSRDERSSRISELEGMKESVVGGGMGRAGPSPNDISQSLDSITLLQQSRANGKISPTDFWSRVDSRLSDIRSRYPVAYRDVIDHAASNILGTDPANAKMASLTADINSWAAGIQAKHKEIHSLLDWAEKEGIGGEGTGGRASVMRGLYDAGKIDENAVHTWLNEAQEPFYREKRKKAELSEYKDNVELQGRRAQGIVEKGLADDAIIAMSTRSDIAGVTPEKVAGRKLSPEEGQIELENLANQKAQFELRARSKFNEPFRMNDGTITTMAALYKNAGLDMEASIKRGSELFDIRMSLLSHPDYGVIHDYERFIKQSQTGVMADMWKNHPNIAELGTKIKYVRENYGETAAQNAIAEMFATSTNVPKPFKTWLAIDRLSREAPKPGEVRTTSDSFSEAQQAGADDPVVFRRIMHNTVGEGGLLDPTSPPERNRVLIDSLFDPKNKDFIGILNRDSQTPAFVAMTSKPMTDIIKRDGISGDGHWFKNYQNWAEISHRNLFGKEMKDLENLQYTHNVSIWYDSERHKWGFTVKDNSGEEIDKNALDSEKTTYYSRKKSQESSFETYPPLVEPGFLRQLRTSLHRLNDGMEGMVHIAESVKIDPDKYIFNHLISHGVNLDPDKIEGFPEAMAAAIRTAREKPAKEKKAFDKLQVHE